ncbi:hypothetical protein [Paenibacillus sp. DR312]|uniref:hypothetical protein n=1 Tax=Paenibacillus sp. DR312 TaxID=2871175 RepID=UPI0021BBF2F6|nr:hypothetical protein [Paenibacillus sp. DR312]
MMNPGSKLPLQIVASYDDGTFGTPKTPISYSSSSPAGLKVSMYDRLEGVKPSSYKLTLSSDTVASAGIRAPQEQELSSNRSDQGLKISQDIPIKQQSSGRSVRMSSNRTQPANFARKKP